MSEEQAGSPVMMQTGDVVPLPISVWSMIFRFTAHTSYFPELERSPLVPMSFDTDGRQLEHDHQLLDAFEAHKQSLVSLSCVCKAWSHALRHFRFEWVAIGNMERVYDLVRTPLEPSYLPIRRLDLSLPLLINNDDIDQMADEICVLISYCIRLEVLAIGAQDARVVDGEASSALYHHRLVRTLANHRDLRKYEVNLVVQDSEDVMFLLNSRPSLETLDIALVCGKEDRVLTVGSSPSLKAMRLSFEEPTTLLLRSLRRHAFPLLDYLWLADYVDPELDENHPALTQAIQAFLGIHGCNLRSLVLVTNAYSLTADMWSVIVAWCPSLIEVVLTLPMDATYIHIRPTNGLPHRSLNTITFNAFDSWAESASASSMDSQTMQYFRSLSRTSKRRQPCVHDPLARPAEHLRDTRSEVGRQRRRDATGTLFRSWNVKRDSVVVMKGRT